MRVVEHTDDVTHSPATGQSGTVGVTVRKNFPLGPHHVHLQHVNYTFRHTRMLDEMYLLHVSSFLTPPPLFLNFIDQPPFPCESSLLSESCMCKLVVSSRLDWKTVSTCVRNEETQVWVLSTFLLSSGSILFSVVTFEVFHFKTFDLAPDSRLSLCAREICKHCTVSGIVSDYTGLYGFQAIVCG